MKASRNLIVWIVLMFLTISTAIVSNYEIAHVFAVIIILVLSAIKFSGVSFFFMELHKAHVFWKLAVVFFVIIQISIVIILLFA